MNNNHPNRSKAILTDAIAILSLDCLTVYGIGLTASEAWQNAIRRTGINKIKQDAFAHPIKIKTPKKLSD